MKAGGGAAAGRGARARAAISYFGMIVAGATIAGALPAVAQQHQQQAVPVDVATPLVKPVREWDQYTGRFEAVKRVEVRARVSGYLKSIEFTDGQTVKEGDLLFVIDPRPYEAELAAAKAQLESARADLRLAQAELKRGEELLRRNVTAEAEVDRRRAQREVANAGVMVAEANVRTAELNLSYTNVRAPVDGRVSDRRVDVGNLISGGSESATLLTTLVALNPIHFVFDTSERAFLKYSRLNKDGLAGVSRDKPTPVYLRLADEDNWPHRGVLNFVDNELGEETGTIRWRAVVNNPEGFLQPGMFGEIRIPGSARYEAVLVPDKAVLSDQANKIVMMVGEGDKVQPRVVQIGPIIEGLRVVRKGLSGSDRIVVNGLQNVRPGTTVKPNEVKIETKADGFNPEPLAGP